MKKIFLLIISILLLNCYEKSIEKPFNQEYMYANEIPGVEAYDSRELKNIVRVIPWKSQVEVLYILNYENSFSRLKFMYQGKEYYSKYSHFSNFQPKLYMKVNVKTNLRLREKPTKNSKILDSLPNGYITEVNEIDPKLYTSEKIKGYWFEIKYNNKYGWIFSGFAISATNESFLNYKNDLNFEAVELENNIESIEEDLKNYTILNKYSINEYELIEAVLTSPSSSDECREDIKLFITNKDKSFYYKSKEFFNKTIKINFPFKNAILVKEKLSGCSYPVENESVIYLGSKPQKLISYLKNDKMKCSIVDGEKRVTYNVINKFSNNNENLILINEPDCNELFNSDHIIDLNSSIFPKEVINEVFVYIKFGDKAEVNVYKDEGIPSKYLDLWKSSNLDLDKINK